MAMVKVKSHTRSGSKVSSYTKNSGSSSTSKRIGDCSTKDVAKKFKELGYMTKISPGISTGNKFIDKIVAKGAAKIANTLVKDTRGKVVIKAAEKAYPHIEKASANIARVKATYDETCKKIK